MAAFPTQVRRGINALPPFFIYLLLLLLFNNSIIYLFAGNAGPARVLTPLRPRHSSARRAQPAFWNASAGLRVWCGYAGRRRRRQGSRTTTTSAAPPSAASPPAPPAGHDLCWGCFHLVLVLFSSLFASPRLILFRLRRYNHLCRAAAATVRPPPRALHDTRGGFGVWCGGCHLRALRALRDPPRRGRRRPQPRRSRRI